MQNSHSFIRLACIVLAFVFATISAHGQKPKLILDADTASEIDDMYAIVRVVKQEKFDPPTVGQRNSSHDAT
jgi:hypothetical protein